MIKNKIYAMVLLLIGVVATALTKEGTFLAFVSFFAVPMFFSKKQWIY